jgi:predicted RNA-binding protein with PUA-like domain
MALPDNLPNASLRSPEMAYWLMKSEPDELSINDLEKLGETRWDGVRNYQARNFLRAMAVGDEFFFYHSSCPEPGIAGIGKITQAAYPDPTALEPDSHYFDAKASAQKNPWSAIDVAHVQTFSNVLGLGYLKQQAALAELPLVQKGSRLSVMPVTAEQWAAIMGLC